MSKLSFRARALDASKPLPIYMSEELPDLPEYSAINRAVPQMPSGMEKEEECEHHLQRAIVTGLIIPTPEVTRIEDMATYDRLYPPTYKPPRQLIRMQPFAMEEDYPDYDIDSEDEKWITMQKLDITPRKFEEMMDRLEKNCAQNFATQDRKELLLKDDDELSIAIYDYWLSKRLKTPQPLVPSVKTEINNRPTGGGGQNNNSNPYLAFRRRTEKMQTRKNRKNDEASYEKMIKLRRDLSRALTLLELVKRRENTKRQLLFATIQLHEKRYQANDLSGALLAEVSALKSVRPAFTPLYTNQYTTANHSAWPIKPPKEEVGIPRKEKRQYKKRKHKALGVSSLSSGEEEPSSPSSPTHQVAFPFLRNKNCSYQAPLSGGKIGNWGWCGPEEGGSGEERYRFSLTSLSSNRCIGLARRRLGRGGRVILDRAGPSMDDFWSSLDFTIHDNYRSFSQPVRHFRPKSPGSRVRTSSESEEEGGLGGSSLSVQVESVGEVTSVEVDLAELFPDAAEADALRSELLIAPPKPPPARRSLLDKFSSSNPSLIDRLFTDLSVKTPPPVQLDSEVVGSSAFNVTDGKDRTSATCGRTNRGPVRSNPPASSDSNPPPASRVPLANGPTTVNSHYDHSSSWLTTMGNNTAVVCKRNSTPITSSTVLNSKLPGRANPAQVNSEEVGEGEKRPNVSARLLHTHPMEVT